MKIYRDPRSFAVISSKQNQFILPEQSGEDDLMSEREIGTVVHGVFDRGFWFVVSSTGRYFCHAANWSEVNPPRVGDRISFELAENSRNGKLQAINARPEPVDYAVGAQTLAKSPIEVGKTANGTEYTVVKL